MLSCLRFRPAEEKPRDDSLVFLLDPLLHTRFTKLYENTAIRLRQGDKFPTSTAGPEIDETMRTPF